MRQRAGVEPRNMAEEAAMPAAHISLALRPGVLAKAARALATVGGRGGMMGDLASAATVGPGAGGTQGAGAVGQRPPPTRRQCRQRSRA